MRVAKTNHLLDCDIQPGKLVRKLGNNSLLYCHPLTVTLFKLKWGQLGVFGNRYAED